MPAFFATLRDLCLFRRGPEDMPYAPPLLAALLIACAALMAGFNLHNGADLRTALASIVGGLGMLVALRLILGARGKPERFVQTLTALATVYLLFGFVADALVFNIDLPALMKQTFEHPQQPPQLPASETLRLLGFSVLGIWQFCTSASIVRRAAEVTLPAGLLFLILMVFADWFVAGLAAIAMGAG